MIQLVLFLVLGAAFLIGLFVFASRSRRAEGGAQAVFEARQALVSLQVELLPPAILGRIFDQQDLAYILARAPEEIQQLFFQERRKVALSWIRQLRKQILNLKQFHL